MSTPSLASHTDGPRLPVDILLSTVAFSNMITQLIGNIILFILSISFLAECDFALFVCWNMIGSRVNRQWKRWIDNHPYLLNHVDFTITPSNMPIEYMFELIRKSGERLHSIRMEPRRRIWRTLSRLSIPLLTSVTIIGHLTNPREVASKLSGVKTLMTTCSCIWSNKEFPIPNPTPGTQLMSWLRGGIKDDIKQRFTCHNIHYDGNCSSCLSKHLIIKRCSSCPRDYCGTCMEFSFSPICCREYPGCLSDRCLQCSHYDIQGEKISCNYHSHRIIPPPSSYWGLPPTCSSSTSIVRFSVEPFDTPTHQISNSK
jgi:hypothetical protein